MVGDVVAVEHVLNAVRGVEDTDGQAPFHAAQGVEEHAFAFIVNGPGLCEKGGFADGAGVQGPGVFGQAERGEGIVQLAKINGIVRGMRNRHRRSFGIKMDGGDIEAKMGR